MIVRHGLIGRPGVRRLPTARRFRVMLANDMLSGVKELRKDRVPSLDWLRGLPFQRELQDLAASRCGRE